MILFLLLFLLNTGHLNLIMCKIWESDSPPLQGCWFWLLVCLFLYCCKLFLCLGSTWDVNLMSSYVFSEPFLKHVQSLYNLPHMCGCFWMSLSLMSDPQKGKSRIEGRNKSINWKLHSRVQLFMTPWTVALQAPLSMEFSRQYWSVLPFPSPWDLLNPGIKPRSPKLQADSLPLRHL